MCGKNKKVHYFYEVSSLQTRCMYTRNAKITDVCFFFNFNPKTNECVLNFGFASQSTVDVTSGGDYHCFLLLLLSPGCRVWKQKPLFFTNQNSEFKFLSLLNFLGPLINNTGDPYIPGQARVRVPHWHMSAKPQWCFWIGQGVRPMFWNSGNLIGSGDVCPQIKSIWFLVL